MITLDNLANRYGMLPSEALARANTLDLVVLDASAKWERYRNERANGKHVPEKPNLTQEQMLEMIRSVKERTK